MTHEERVLKHEYSLEGIHEHAERIAKLEELVLALWPFVSKADRAQWPELADRMRELGIEEDE